jgi:outer membrane protein
MKKILLMVAMLFATNFAFAQLSKGNLLVTGAFSVGSTSQENTINSKTTDGPSTSNFSIIPNVSYFINDRLSVGVELGYSSLSAELVDVRSSSTTVTTKDVTSGLGLSPFVRYYFPLGQKFYFYGQGGFGITSGKINNTTTTVTTFFGTQTTEVKSESDLSAFNVGFRPGITYFFTDRFALDASFGLLNYSNTTVKLDKDETKNSELNFNIIPNSLNFGLSYRFGGGK